MVHTNFGCVVYCPVGHTILLKSKAITSVASARKRSLTMLTLMIPNYPVEIVLPAGKSHRQRASYCDNPHLLAGEMYQLYQSKSHSNCQLKNTAYWIFLSWWALGSIACNLPATENQCIVKVIEGQGHRTT